MKKKKVSKNYMILVLAVVILAVVIVLSNYPKQEVTYLNDNGEEWSLPDGNYVFQVSSGEGVYPKFLSGEIDPVKVLVGDIQRMKIVVEGDVSLVRIWAEIERDGGITLVDLELKEKNDGIYTYIGEWEVFDTHTKTYHTTFFAEDENGRINEMTLAWSDPICDFSAGTLQSGCTLSNANDVEGVDGQNMRLGTSDILLNNGYLVINEGYTIYLESGRIILGGGIITKGYLFYTDNDGDRYAIDLNKKYHDTSSTLIGMVRVKDVLSTVNEDCYDNNASAYPGQSAWFIVHRGDGSFDYDCDGSGTGDTAPAVGQCDDFHGLLCPVDAERTGRMGYTTSVECGNPGTYVTIPGGCYSCPRGMIPGLCECVTETRLNDCTDPEKQYTESGQCSKYTSEFCTFDTQKEPKIGFTDPVSCGNPGTYITDGGSRCIEGQLNPVVSNCIEETKTQACR